MRYPEVQHSYILELKYLSVKDYEAHAEDQWQDAVRQLRLYTEAPRVRQMIQDTRLHCIVMQFSGWELARMEEI